MKFGRRLGEFMMVIGGVGLAIGSGAAGLSFLAYGGLCIAGLGVVSMFWN